MRHIVGWLAAAVAVWMATMGGQALADGWYATGPVAVGRAQAHTLTTLPNGRAVVAGGLVSGPTRATASAEVYDPNTNSWTPPAL